MYGLYTQKILRFDTEREFNQVVFLLALLKFTAMDFKKELIILTSLIPLEESLNALTR